VIFLNTLLIYYVVHFLISPSVFENLNVDRLSIKLFLFKKLYLLENMSTLLLYSFYFPLQVLTIARKSNLPLVKLSNLKYLNTFLDGRELIYYINVFENKCTVGIVLLYYLEGVEKYNSFYEG